MRSFNMGRFGNSDDPWFRVGTVDVNTTIFVVGVGVLSMFVWAVEGDKHPLLSKLFLLPSRVADGQIWRLFTWPIANEPDFWTLLLFAVFFMLGSQLEAMMGRILFTRYLVVMTIVPAIIATIFYLTFGMTGGAFGLRFLELGVLVGFALHRPNAPFFFGIPAWGIAAAIVTLDLLQYVGAGGQGFSIVLLLSIVGVSMLTLRAFGFAEDAQWLPKVPIPAAYGGAPKRASTTKSRSTTKRKRRSRANLTVAPEPSGSAPRRELSKLEEAEMDSILDQVSERGMDSLTDQQRQRLEDHAKRLRRRGE